MADPSVYTNKSRVIHRGPCVVKDVHMAADGDAGEVIVYDGVNANGELKAHIDAISGTSFDWTPGTGTEFIVGIYIACSSTAAKCTVTFEPVSCKSQE